MEAGSPGSAGLSKADLRTSPACFGAHLLQWSGKGQISNSVFSCIKILDKSETCSCLPRRATPGGEGESNSKVQYSKIGTLAVKIRFLFVVVDCLTARTLMTVPSARRRCSKTSQSSETELRKVASSWARISPLPGRERRNI